MAEAQRDEIAKLEALYAANPEGHVFTHLAEAYRKAGELDRAREILKEGLRRHPDSASAHVVLGKVEHDRADNDAAREAFTRVLSLDGDNLIALRFLGDLALERGDRAEALGHYQELLSRDVADPALQQTVDDLRQYPAPAAPLAAVAAEEPGPQPEGTEVRQEPLSTPTPEEAILAPEPVGEAAVAPEVPGGDWVSEAEPAAETGIRGELEGEAAEPATEPWSEAATAEPLAATTPGAGVEAEEPWAPAVNEEAADEEAPFEETWVPAPEAEGAVPEPWAAATEAEAEPEAWVEPQPQEPPAFDTAPDSWEVGEPEYLTIEYQPDATGEPDFLPPAEGEPGEDSEYLSVNLESDLAAAGPEFLELGGEAESWTGPEPEFPDIPAAAEGVPPVGEEWSQEPVSVDPGWEPDEQSAAMGAADVPAEQPAAAEGAAEGGAATEPGAGAVEWTGDAAEPVAEAPVAAADEAMEPTVTAAEADLVLAAAFEAPSEPIPTLEEVTALGDIPRADEVAPGDLQAGVDREAAAGLYTETMAELYRAQGFADRAADVYRWLLSRDPGNERLQQRLAEVAGDSPVAAPAASEPPQRAWLQELQGVEAAFTGAAGAAQGGESPYDWSSPGDEVANLGPSIGEYFRRLLAWRPTQAVSAAAPRGSVPELLLDDVVSEEPNPERGAADTAAPAVGEDLMPWEFSEPPALATSGEPGQLEPEAGELGTAPQAPSGGDEASGEVEAEDEDLEMFRSWLQSLKK